MLGLVAVIFAVSGQQGAMIASFETAADLAKVAQNSITVTLTEGKGVTEGSHAALVRFAPGPWPNITFHVGQGFASGDWRQYGGVAFDATNLEPDEVWLATRVDDDPAADGARHSRTGWTYLSLVQGKTATVEITFDRLPEVRRGPTILPGAIPTTQDGPAGEPLDFSHIAAFEIWLPGPTRTHAMVIDNVRLLPKVDIKGIVDRYGQYSRVDWPGKVHDDADFAKQRDAERAWTDAQRRPADVDEYGGWAKGPKLRASGFFRTAYVVDGREVAWKGAVPGGKWWLVTPSGHLFFSHGIDGVAMPTEATHIGGRDEIFAGLPAAGDPLSEFVFGTTDRWADFYSMALRRKYGTDWRAKSADVAARRMVAWGFNTLGNWSAPEVCALHKVPYTVPIAFAWFDFHRKLKYFPTAALGDQVDVFDEAYPATLEELLTNPPMDAAPPWVEKHTIAATKDDPWCIGYFFENECAWARWDDIGERWPDFGLATAVLGADGKLAAKRVFVEALKAKYGEVGKLNAAWGTGFDSWEKMTAEAVKLPAAMSDALKTDLTELLRLFARRHYEVAGAMLKKLAPNHLNLGSRLVNLPRDREIVRVAAENCDVVSFNVYELGLREEKWRFTDDLGKPCLIGEYHFGALDRGRWHVGCCGAHDQAERGWEYQAYVRSVWARPAFVGCHWFQYHDEPLTGRWDGENYNLGFVSGVDEPFWEVVKAAKAVNGEVYAVRGGGK